VLNGDIADCFPINHHNMAKQNHKAVEGAKLGDHMKCTRRYIEEAIKWAKKTIYLKGNHERFISDFTDHYPMLDDVLSTRLMLRLDELDIEYLPLHKNFRVGDGNVVHGDVVQKLYQVFGNGIHKARRVYGSKLMMGHGHFPKICNDVYQCGLIGNYKQPYIGEEPTSWLHGFGRIDIYKGRAFMSLMNIIDTHGHKELYFDGKKYSNES
jgi:hypothetical protein